MADKKWTSQDTIKRENISVLKRMCSQALPLFTSDAYIIFFYQFSSYSRSMSLAPHFPNYNLDSSPLQFREEVNGYLFDKDKKFFKYKSYLYGWSVFERNQTQGTY